MVRIVAALAVIVTAGPALAGAISAQGDDGSQASPESVAPFLPPGALLIALAIWLAPAAVCVGVCWLLGLLSPGGLDRPEPRRVDAFPAWVWVAAAAGVWVLQQAGSVIASIVAGLLVSGGDADQAAARAAAAGEGPDPRVLALSVAGSFALAIPLALGALWLVSRHAPGAGLRPRLIDPALGLAGLLLLGPMIMVVNVVVTWIVTTVDGPPQQITHDLLRLLGEGRDGGTLLVWGIVFGAVVGAPIVEETIFRGFLQSAARRLLGSPWVAIVLTSALFALVHWFSLSGGRYAMIVIFALSLGLGAAFERTKSIAVPMVMHALFNGSQIALVLLASPS